LDEQKRIKISVRDLVEFVLQEGDIRSSFSGSSRALEGTKAHQMLQKGRGKDYQAEVTISYIVDKEDIVLEINGRIDGVINTEGNITLEEIKSTNTDLNYIDENYNKLHMAQIKCYGFMYTKNNSLENINISLVYYHLETGEKKTIERSFHEEELKIFFDELVDKYIIWAKVLKNWAEFRDTSIKELKFPFDNYRKGQREFAVSVYRSIRDGNLLFAAAPTGTGKTAAVLFPTIKALGEGSVSKIFYLTAKTVTRTIAENSILNMKDRGLRLKTLTLTAKEKICLKPGAECSPEECEYAKGHFDRVKDAVADIFIHDSFNYETILEYAKKHSVCPFEFSLDLSLWADCIICDYNYVFDPRVYLKRFFLDGGGDFAFLIDEAHNLVDRSREMYSSEISKREFMDLRNSFKESSKKINKALNKINSQFIGYKKNIEEEYLVDNDEPKDIVPLLRSFITLGEEWLLKNDKSPIREAVLELYFKVTGFLRTTEGYDENYVTYYEKLKDHDLKLKLFCVNPSYLLKEAIKRGKSTIFFSATLSPMDYFISILGGNEKSTRLRLRSPFPEGNLSILINNKIATTYKKREFSYEDVASWILNIVKIKKGNYLVFFPSYSYMNRVNEIFIEKSEDIYVIIQKSGMTEEEKANFLKEFSEDRVETLVAFAVMGGSFGEGIDLTGDKLLGAIIVGVGLPQVCLERNIILDYFNKLNNRGFEYSYMYPGMNKVLQAIGRVIRSESDKGIVLLIDERFSRQEYKNLFPAEWKLLKYTRVIEEAKDFARVFWDNKS